MRILSHVGRIIVIEEIVCGDREVENERQDEQTQAEQESPNRLPVLEWSQLAVLRT